MALTEKQPSAKIAVRAKVVIGDNEHDVLYFDPSPTESVDTVEVKAVGAAQTIYLPGALVNTATLEVKILKDGAAPAVGSLVDLKLTIDESTNGATPTSSDEKSIPCFVQQVAEDRIEGDGASRVEAYVITLQPTALAPSV